MLAVQLPYNATAPPYIPVLLINVALALSLKYMLDLSSKSIAAPILAVLLLNTAKELFSKDTLLLYEENIVPPNCQ